MGGENTEYSPHSIRRVRRRGGFSLGVRVNSLRTTRGLLFFYIKKEKKRKKRKEGSESYTRAPSRIVSTHTHTHVYITLRSRDKGLCLSVL